MKRQLKKSIIVKKNAKKAKVLKIISPIVFWVCLALSIFCIFLALKNSFGNVGEILTKLNTKGLTGEQLQENYAYLVNKYGEWVIGSGSKGFTITFIDIGNALFSGVMMLSIIFAIVFALCSVLLGKWLLPSLANSLLQDSQTMTNVALLENIEKNENK